MQTQEQAMKTQAELERDLDWERARKEWLQSEIDRKDAELVAFARSMSEALAKV